MIQTELGKACFLKAGKFVSTNDIAKVKKDGLYPCYGGNGIRGYVSDYTHEGTFPLIGRQGALCGNVNFASGKFHATEHAVVVHPLLDIDVRWLFYKLCAMNLGQYATGAAQPGLAVSALEKLSIQIPDRFKQHKIALMMDKIDKLIAMRKKQLQKLDDLVKSRFVELFGDPVNNPMKWKTMTFRQASIRLSDGPFGSNLKSEHYTPSGIRVIRLGNIGVGKFLDDDQSYISAEHYETIKKYTCKAGDIVIGTLGDPNLRACLIPKEIEIAINKADCVHYVPKADILDKYFVCQYINCPETLLLASGMIHGQTRTRVSSGQIAEMLIFVPPLKLQQQFATFVEQTDKSKLTIQQSLDKLELMKKALMQKYFG